MANYSLELMHHGKKGQQWGVRNAEWYPIDAYRDHLKKSGYNKEQIDKITDAINDPKRSDRRHSKYVNKVIKKQTAEKNKLHRAQEAKRLESLEKARRTKEAKEKYDTEKSKAINTGNLDYARGNLEFLSDMELKELLYRNEQKSNIQKAEESAKRAKMDKMVARMGTLQDATQKLMNAANNASNLYNTVAKAANTFGDTNLPIIGQAKEKPKADRIDYEREYDKTGKMTFEKKTIKTSGGDIVEKRRFESGESSGGSSEGKSKKEKKSTTPSPEPARETRTPESTPSAPEERSSTRTRTPEAEAPRIVEVSRPKPASAPSNKAEKWYSVKKETKPVETKKPTTTASLPEIKTAKNMDSLFEAFYDLSGSYGNDLRSGKINESQYKKEIAKLQQAFNEQRGKISK